MINYNFNNESILEKEQNKYPVLLKWIKDRISHNKNAIIVVNGMTGSGKSYASLTLGWDLAGIFNTPLSIENNVAFRFEDTLDNIENNEGVPGEVYIMEEVGSTQSGSSAREWQSKANILFTSFMQTNRCKNQILILNCPSFSNLDKGTRELCHFQLEAIAINPTKKHSIFKPFEIQMNTRTQKLYFKFLRYIDGYGVKRKVKQVNFTLPPADIVRDYEKKKMKFVNDLNKYLRLQLKKKDNAEKDKEQKILEKEKRDKGMLAMYKSGLNQGEIAKHYGVTRKTVCNNIKSIKEQLNSD